MKLSKFKHTAILFATISTASIPTMAHADWSIAGLSTFGGNSSYSTGINDSGQIVGGFFDTSGKNHIFITGTDGVGMTDLGTFGGISSVATGINNSGQVVGTSAAGGIHSFVTGPDGVGVTDLEKFRSVNGINDSGQMVGDNFTATSTYQAFIISPDGVNTTDLGSLDGGDAGANAINNSGQVVGYSEVAGVPHAFITGPDDVGMTDLGTLGGNLSNAGDINNAGQVVGDSRVRVVIGTNEPIHAFITGPKGVGMTDLGTLGGDYYTTFSTARAINDLGEVVGIANGAGNNNEHSFLFSHGGMTDLSLLDIVIANGWTSINVVDINNNGQIIGKGLHNGHIEAFLLSYTPDTIFTPNPIFIPTPPSPIPEPETYLMLLAGLGLIGFMARRRKETTV